MHSETQGNQAETFSSTGVCIDEAFDTGIFEDNLHALAKSDPILAQALKLRSPQCKDYTLHFDSGFLPGLGYKGRALVSWYDPQGEAQRVAEKALSPGFGMIVGFGFGLGYQIPPLLESKQVETLYVFEPSLDLLFNVFGIIDLSDYLSDSRLSIVTDLRELFFQMPFAERLRPALAEAPLPGYVNLFPDAYRELDQRLMDMVRNTDMIVSTVLARDRTWFDYITGNFRHYFDLPGIGRLRGKFAGVPAVIVAAGPSLDKNYRLLEKVKGNGLIFSVGTALKKITGLGFGPDITLAIESNDILYQFEGAEHTDQSYLALSLNCNPKLWELPFRGKICFAGTTPDNAVMMELTGKKNAVMQTGGSVACAAFSMAVGLGCNPIVLIGQDLAYGNDEGKFHAEGVGRWDENPLKKRKEKGRLTDGELHKMALCRLEGYNGGTVISQDNLAHYLMWFERVIPEVKAAGVHVINATEGGAKIHGALQLPFAEAVEKYFRQEHSVTEKLDLLCNADPPDVKKVTERFESLLEKAKRLQKLSACQRDDVKKVFDGLRKINPDIRAIDRKVTKIDKREKEITELTMALDPLLSPLLNREMLIATKCFEYDDNARPEDTLRQNMRQSHVLYKGIAANSQKLVDALAGICDFLHSRNT